MEYSVFDRRTGETHILGILAVELLDILQDRPASLTSLAKELAGRCEQDDSPEWRNKVSSILSGLDVLELVEPCPG